MLFSFNFFWKLILTNVGFWIFYSIVGFEIATITLLASILSFKSNLVVIILLGVSDATFSISIPPSVLLIKAIFELSLSIKQDK